MNYLWNFHLNIHIFYFYKIEKHLWSHPKGQIYLILAVGWSPLSDFVVKSWNNQTFVIVQGYKLDFSLIYIYIYVKLCCLELLVRQICREYYPFVFSCLELIPQNNGTYFISFIWFSHQNLCLNERDVFLLELELYYSISRNSIR